MEKKLKRWESGASKLKAKQERDKRQSQLRQSIPNISSFFTASNVKSCGSLTVSEPAVEDENVDGISDSEEQDGQDRYPADASTSPAHPQRQRGALTETVTVTCSSAAPLASLTSLEGPPDGRGEANDAADDPVSDPADNAADDATDDSRDLPVTTPLRPAAPEAEPEMQEWYEKTTDPALWKDTTSDKIKTVLIQRGAAEFHNRRSTYPASARDRNIGGKSRHFNNDLLYCCLPNGQKVMRDWMMYSPSNGNIYCFACKLFSKCHHQFVEGFSDWKHSERIRDHERSEEHKAAMLSLLHRGKGIGTVDVSMAT